MLRSVRIDVNEIFFIEKVTQTYNDGTGILLQRHGDNLI